VTSVTFRHTSLRWPFPLDLPTLLASRTIRDIGRRGKYLLLHFDHGTVIIHLGMSGHLRILDSGIAPQKHDYFDLAVGSQLLRLSDPRRFGAVLWHAAEDGPVEQHILLAGLGMEPLEEVFSAQILYQKTRNRAAPIKQVLLAGDIVVGVGNIYASESLFRAGINPKIAAHRISLARYALLVDAIRITLAAAIENGGSTLRDFVGVNGQSGYFQQSYFVYGRTGFPCRNCGTLITQIKQRQRSTFYCKKCQK